MSLDPALAQVATAGQVSPDPDVADADVADALTRSPRSWRFTYDLVDDDGRVLGSPEVESCTVANADLADVQRTAECAIRDLGDINFATDRLSPRVHLRMPGGGWVAWPMGVFILSSPQQKRSLKEGARSRAVTGFDRGLVLRDDKILDRFVIQKNTLYTDAVQSVLASAGLVTSSIAGSDRALPAPLEWPPGTSKATIVNEMLGAINYRSLYFDGLGRPVAEEYQSPLEAPPVWRYEPNKVSVLRPESEESFDVLGVPNVFVLTVSEPDRPELRAVYENSSEDSPTSTLNVGRRIVDFRSDLDAADQATLDARVARIAQEASQVFSTVRYATSLMPFHGAADVVLLDVGGGVQRYRETEWSLPLAVGGEMTHSARRVVPV